MIFRTIVALLLLCVSSFAQTGAVQTVTGIDGTVLIPASNVHKIGMNGTSVTYFDNGLTIKNILCTQNCGFERLQGRNHYLIIGTTGTTTTFQPNNTLLLPANYLTGAGNTCGAQGVGNGTSPCSYFYVSYSSVGNKGCSGYIASNTTGTSGSVPPTITVVATATVLYNPTTNTTTSTPISGGACPAAIAQGDQIDITVTFPNDYTKNGMGCSVSNGGVITFDNTTQYSGTQSIILDTTAGSSAGAVCISYFDSTTSVDNFVTLNGTYTYSFRAKSRAGNTAQFYAQMKRLGGTTCTMPISAAPPTTWTLYSTTCTFAENGSTVANDMQNQFNMNGQGSIEFDDLKFYKSSGQDSTNTSVFRDEYVAALRALCGSTGPTCTLRDWMSQNGETFAQWISTDSTAAQTFSGQITATAGSFTPRLQNFLQLVYITHATPYVMMPVTFSNSDGAAEIEYLTSTNLTSGWGQVRQAQCAAQPELATCANGGIPWVGPTGVFPQIYLTYCNECWNDAFAFNAQNIPISQYSTPDGRYADYWHRLGYMYHDLRASSFFIPKTIQLGFDMQEGVALDMNKALAGVNAVQGYVDYVEQAAYYAPLVTDVIDYPAALAESWAKTHDTSDLTSYYPAAATVVALNLCGVNGTGKCPIDIYEFGDGSQGTCGANWPACGSSPNVAITQAHLDQFSAGAIQGLTQPLMSLDNRKYLLIQADNIFGATGYSTPSYSSPALNTLIWGNYTDFGGKQSYVNGVQYIEKPAVIGSRVANLGIIGAETNCTVSGTTLGNPGNPYFIPLNAQPSMPAVECFRYWDGGTNFSYILVNRDTTNSYPISFAGTNIPTGTVTVDQYAPGVANLGNLNQATTAVGYTGNTLTTVAAIPTSTQPATTSLTIPPASMTVLRYSTAGAVRGGLGNAQGVIFGSVYIH